MSQKQLKEAFISNLNGTSLLEISAGLSLLPLCLLCRGLLLILYYLHHGKPVSSRKYSLLLDFLVLVSPLVFSCTVLSPIIFFIPVILAAFCAGIFSKIYSQTKRDARVPFGQIVKEFQKARLDPECIPAITVFRVYINVLTSISILAVDFPQYPRRYAKAETYGTGAMDLGVGAFIFGNALVCPEVRQKPRRTQPRFSSLARQVFSVWPLIALGAGRLLSVKSIQYHEHTSEYGVHWNFFFTLAVDQPQHASSPGCSGVSFEVRSYPEDSRQYPISKPHCPREQVFLPGKEAHANEHRKGLAAFPPPWR